MSAKLRLARQFIGSQLFWEKAKNPRLHEFYFEFVLWLPFNIRAFLRPNSVRQLLPIMTRVADS
jgi:hypothetical protein